MDWRRETLMVAWLFAWGCSSSSRAPSGGDGGSDVVDVDSGGGMDADPPAVDAGSESDPLAGCLPEGAGPAVLGPLVDVGAMDAPYAQGSIDSLAVSPDGSRVLFVGDIEVTGMKRLYAAPITGGESTLLSHNAESQPGRDVLEFRVPVTGDHVVYWGDVDTPDLFHLHSVPLNGGDPFPLSQNFTGSVEPGFRLSDNGHWVLFESSPLASPTELALFAVPADIDDEPAFAMTHSGATAPQGLRHFEFDRGPSQVVYSGDTETLGVIRVHYQVLGGGGIFDALPADADGSEEIGEFFALSDQSLGFVVFSSRRPAHTGQRLYSKELSTKPARLIYDSSLNTAMESIRPLSVPAIDEVLIEAVPVGATDAALYALSLTALGAQELLLSAGLAVQGGTGVVVEGATADQVLFNGSEQDGIHRLFGVPLAGGVPKLLSAGVEVEDSDPTKKPLASSDGKRVVFWGIADDTGEEVVQANCVEGGQAMDLTPHSDVAGAGPFIQTGRWLDPLGRFVLLRGHLGASAPDRLYLADMFNGDIHAVDTNLDDTGLGVRAAAFSPNGQHLVFTHDPLPSEAPRIYSRVIDR